MFLLPGPGCKGDGETRAFPLALLKGKQWQKTFQLMRNEKAWNKGWLRPEKKIYFFPFLLICQRLENHHHEYHEINFEFQST